MCCDLVQQTVRQQTVIRYSDLQLAMRIIGGVDFNTWRLCPFFTQLLFCTEKVQNPFDMFASSKARDVKISAAAGVLACRESPDFNLVWVAAGRWDFIVCEGGVTTPEDFKGFDFRGSAPSPPRHLFVIGGAPAHEFRLLDLGLVPCSGSLICQFSFSFPDVVT